MFLTKKERIICIIKTIHCLISLMLINFMNFILQIITNVLPDCLCINPFHATVLCLWCVVGTSITRSVVTSLTG